MTDLVTAAPALAASARSDAGRVRSNNEDLAVLDAPRGVFGVIDGVGGHAAGEFAAAIARDVILQRLARPLGTPAERVREAIAIANNEIFRRAHDTPALAGMTCVVTLALVHDGRLTAGHVGDTRLYKLRPHGLQKLTHDHSPVGEREDAQQIDELAAMRHPRRHEVFRDVGSALRDKDEPEYVEIVEDVIEDDAAILVCSDGLTDMVPSTAIEQIVRRHAGDVEAVTAALVAAANEAGGRDNVTVVYAEAAGFAAAVRAAGSAGPDPAPTVMPPRPHAGSRRWLWFAAGLLIGLLAAAGAAWRLLQVPSLGGRTIAAAPAASETVPTLATALAMAQGGDVVRLEPGTYREQIVVPAGVSLRARIAGTAVFTRPPEAAGEWVAVTLLGDTGGTLSGIRVTSTDRAPVQVGVRVLGQGRTIDLLQVDGATVAAVDVAADAAATLQGAHLQVSGPAVVVGARGQLDLQGSILLRRGGPSAVGRRQAETPPLEAARPRGRTDRSTAVPQAPAMPAVVIGEGARAAVERSVFVDFGTDPVPGLPDAERERLRVANVMITAASSPVR